MISARVFNIRIRVLKNCFLFLVIAALAVASGCSSDAPASNDTKPDDGGVTTMTIDPDSSQ